MDFDAILIIVNTVTAYTVKNEGENTLSVPKITSDTSLYQTINQSNPGMKMLFSTFF